MHIQQCCAVAVVSPEVSAVLCGYIGGHVGIEWHLHWLHRQDTQLVAGFESGLPVTGRLESIAPVFHEIVQVCANPDKAGCFSARVVK